MFALRAKIQISLGIRAVWSEASLGAFWIAADAKFLHADIEDSDQTARIRRLIWVFVGSTYQKVRFLTLWLILSQAVMNRMSRQVAPYNSKACQLKNTK